MMSNDQLRRIVAQASTLHERLGRGVAMDGDGHNERQVKKRIERWQDRLAKGDAKKWKQRLALDGIEHNQIGVILGGVPDIDGATMPTWATTLAKVVEVSKSIPSDELRRGFAIRAIERSETTDEKAADGKVPAVRFEAFVLPLVEVAWRRLSELARGDSLALLTGAARAALQQDILARLSGLCWQTLQWEFSIFRSTRRSSIFYRFTKEGQPPTTDLYQAFVEKFHGDGMIDFFEQYPVLGRLVATRIELWGQATTEFLRRLRDDLPRLQETFAEEGPGEEPAEVGLVKSIVPGLSDPHNGGRMAAVLTFESGLKIVYKPRNVGLESAWFSFLDWANRHGTPEQLAVVNVLDQDTYGWVEFVTHEPAEDAAAAARYFRRVGTLMALLHVLEGTDFHQENIVAHGDQPVLVDLEMILQPRLKPPGDAGTVAAELEAAELMSNSVLRSGLLPHWNIDRPGEAVDMSGLGSLEGSQMPEAPQLNHVNSDSMDVVMRRAKATRTTNTLILDEQPRSADDHADEIVAGFDRMYRFLADNRTDIAAEDGPLVDMSGQMVRFVFRPTRLYAQLLHFALQPRYLRDGLDRSIELEMLSSRFLRGEASDRSFWPLLRHEIDSLEQLDVPVFHVRSDESGVRLGNELVVENCFRETSDARVRSRLDALNNDDCQQQIKIIRNSLTCRAVRNTGSTAERPTGAVDFGEVKPINSNDALAAAVEIGDELSQRALVAADGSATWIGLEFVPVAERWRLQPVGRELYGGGCGIALFLATLANATGEHVYRQLALGALASVKQLLRDVDVESRLDETVSVGGATGIASYVHTLVRASQLLEAGELLDDAKRAAALITSRRLKHDGSLDVVTGAAGGILGLLSLHRAGGNGQAIEAAVACGQHLLDNRTESMAGPRAWKTMPHTDSPLTGFGHGAAGNALALLRLYEATRDSQYKDAAEEAMDYERSVFSAERGNWPDLRKTSAEGEQGFMVAWCAGAAGIGLARLAGLSILDTPEVRDEIDSAVNTTINEGLGARDHLCCGTMGLSDTLLSFARGLSRPELERHARHKAALVVLRAKQHGYRLLDIDAEDVFVPGMFQGLAGIGYAFLRLADPEAVPSILLFD